MVRTNIAGTTTFPLLSISFIAQWMSFFPMGVYAQAQAPLICSTHVPVPLIARAEGLSEQVSDPGVTLAIE